jgi:hypothetical protein
MTVAAREASLQIIMLLVEHGGVIDGTDLVAQAAIGDSRGETGRLEVIEYLLDHGAPIDAVAGSTWKPRNTFQVYRSRMEEFVNIYDGGRRRCSWRSVREIKF